MKTHRLAPIALLGLIVGCPAVSADPPALPGSGFTAPRYQTLWTKSPFAVETPEAAPDSPDYSLVGVATFDGVNYASLIDKRTQEHILVSSGKPAEGFTLVSVTRGHDISDTSVVLQKDSQTLSLKLEQPSLTASALPSGMPPIGAPQPQPLPMPGSPGMGGTAMTPQDQALARMKTFRARRLIHLPVPTQIAQPAPPPPQ